MAKIAIIGANSFIGKSLIDHFLTNDNSVVGFNRNVQNNLKMNFFLGNKNIKKLELVHADLNNDIEIIAKKIKKFKPEIIIDAGGQGMVAESWIDPSNWFTTNLVSKSILFKEILSSSFLRKYIKISTPEVYGSSLKKLQTHSPYNPSTPYAVSHASVDMLLNAYFKESNFPAVIARFANFYGPEQQLYRIIPKAIIKCLNSEKIELHGGGNSKRSFIYKTDFISAVEAIIEKGKIGNVYHFSDNQVYKIKDVVKIICELLKVDYDKNTVSVKERKGKDFMYSLDISKSKSINWEPKIELKEGISKTIDWIYENKNSLLKMNNEYKYNP